MIAEHCIAFARAIGIDDAEIAESTQGTWVRGTCPMGWLHPAGRDRHPSFGIRVVDEGESYWNCFAHGSGSLPKLLHSLQFNYGQYLQRASRILTLFERVETDDADVWPSYEEVSELERSIPLQAISQEVLDQFPVVSGRRTRVARMAQKFLIEDRGIDMDIIGQYDVRYWAEQHCIILPIRDGHDNLCHLVVRKINEKTFFFMTPDLAGFPRECFATISQTGAFFGMDHVDREQPVMLVESPLEALTVISLGFTNVIASCGPINAAQLRNLYYSTLWLGFDDDAAGWRSRDKTIGKLRGKTRLFVINWGDCGAKDPGELHELAQLDAAISNMREVVPERRW